MAGVSPYGALLSQAASAGGPPMGGPPQMPGPNPAAGPGPVPPMPGMPGLPPSPSNVGKIDGISGAKSPKEAASDAILSLRDLKGHYPNLAPQIDGFVESIKTATRPGGAAQGPGANDKVSPPPPAPPKLGDGMPKTPATPADVDFD